MKTSHFYFHKFTKQKPPILTGNEENGINSHFLTPPLTFKYYQIMIKNKNEKRMRNSEKKVRVLLLYILYYINYLI